jgi:hypothetical protein
MSQLRIVQHEPVVTLTQREIDHLEAVAREAGRRQERA